VAYLYYFATDGELFRARATSIDDKCQSASRDEFIVSAAASCAAPNVNVNFSSAREYNRSNEHDSSTSPQVSKEAEKFVFSLSLVN
jgi:hypothetical protein